MGEVIRVTTDEELDQHFKGILIWVREPFGDDHNVPGWECRHCGWKIGSIGYPPSHTCPDDGERQGHKQS